MFACCQSSHSPGAKVTLPSSASFENTTGPKGGDQTRVSTNDITHGLRGKVILPAGTLQGSLHQNHVQGGLRHLYITHYGIFTVRNMLLSVCMCYFFGAKYLRRK